MRIVAQFSTEAGISSWLLRWFTHSHFSHVDIQLSDGSLIGARLSGGVRLRPSNYAKFTRIERIAIDVSETEYAAAIDWLYSKIGTKYDIKAIFAFMFNRNWRDMKRLFCSEYYIDLLEYLKKIRVRTPANRITPNDAYLLAYTIGYEYNGNNLTSGTMV